MADFLCRHCFHGVYANRDAIGEEFTCPKCKEKSLVPEERYRFSGEEKWDLCIVKEEWFPGDSLAISVIGSTFLLMSILFLLILFKVF